MVTNITSFSYGQDYTCDIVTLPGGLICGGSCPPGTNCKFNPIDGMFINPSCGCYPIKCKQDDDCLASTGEKGICIEDNICLPLVVNETAVPESAPELAVPE